MKKTLVTLLAMILVLINTNAQFKQINVSPIVTKQMNGLVSSFKLEKFTEQVVINNHFTIPQSSELIRGVYMINTSLIQKETRPYLIITSYVAGVVVIGGVATYVNSLPEDKMKHVSLGYAMGFSTTFGLYKFLIKVTVWNPRTCKIIAGIFGLTTIGVLAWSKEKYIDKTFSQEDFNYGFLAGIIGISTSVVLNWKSIDKKHIPIP